MENIELTEEQEVIIKKVISLLKPFFINDKSQERQTVVYYFKDKNDEEFGSEYDTCSDTSCRNASKKQIRIDRGKHTRISEVYTPTGNDNDSIPRCSICGKPFEEYLAWIEYEFEYYESNIPTYENLKQDTSMAFDLSAIFDSIPSHDNTIGQYEKNQFKLGNEKPLLDILERQRNLIERVINYAILIIKIIENE